MLRYITKREIWELMDRGVHGQLGWNKTNAHLKTWQDLAIYGHIADLKGACIAEIGGGHSRILRKLGPENECVNVDRLAGEHGGPKGEASLPGVKTVKAFLGEFHPDLPSNHFDHVISVSVIEHVPEENADSVLEDMLRILKPGGTAMHAVDIYVGDRPIEFSEKRLRIYRRWLDHSGLEPLGPVEAMSSEFRCDMISNHDFTMWQWNNAAPALKEMRMTTQNVSLLLGFRKRSD